MGAAAIKCLVAFPVAILATITFTAVLLTFSSDDYLDKQPFPPTSPTIAVGALWALFVLWCLCYPSICFKGRNFTAFMLPTLSKTAFDVQT
jgi:O-antigen ligase